MYFIRCIFQFVVHTIDMSLVIVDTNLLAADVFEFLNLSIYFHILLNTIIWFQVACSNPLYGIAIV